MPQTRKGWSLEGAERLKALSNGLAIVVRRFSPRLGRMSDGVIGAATECHDDGVQRKSRMSAW